MTAFEEIYRSHFQDVYRYALRLTGGDEAAADELTGETFFRALRAIDRFRGDCSLRVWLCQIAKNCRISQLRAERRTESLDEPALSDLPDPARSPEEVLLEDAERAAVRTAVNSLPEPYRRVFCQRAEAGRGFRAIGADFGKSENWACVTYHRARAMLKAKLEELS